MTPGTEPQLLEIVSSQDSRGTFAKPFPLPAASGIEFEVKEIFSTSSGRGVVRGMHFQFEPDQIAKIVWVTTGSIFDVLVDLRDHDGFGTAYSWELNSTAGNALLVPAGFAHGFQSLEAGSVVNYAVDDVFSPGRDAGIRWDSVGVSWPLAVTEMSARDTAHPSLDDFDYRFTSPA
ncbi:MAG: dTDP-4-dehydrorhamnose 35-epimerase related [Microbacteriaceae bacterium]|nr:dTDP-4-dehydrorhamnose 35-epimerase related [Microbacteriaceae bacterium]